MVHPTVTHHPSNNVTHPHPRHRLNNNVAHPKGKHGARPKNPKPKTGITDTNVYHLNYYN